MRRCVAACRRHLGGDAKFSRQRSVAPARHIQLQAQDRRRRPELRWPRCGAATARSTRSRSHRLIGVDLANPAATNAHSRQPRTEHDSAPVDLDKYPNCVQGARPQDRRPLHGHLPHCWPLPQGRADPGRNHLGGAHPRGPEERLDERRDDDLAEVWLKLDDEQRRTERMAGHSDSTGGADAEDAPRLHSSDYLALLTAALAGPQPSAACSRQPAYRRRGHRQVAAVGVGVAGDHHGPRAARVGVTVPRPGRRHHSVCTEDDWCSGGAAAAGARRRRYGPGVPVICIEKDGSGAPDVPPRHRT